MDILDSVFYHLSETMYDVITFLIYEKKKREYLYKKKKKFQEGPKNAILLYNLKSRSNKQQLFFFTS